MKKTIILVLIVLMLITGLFVLTGCKNNENAGDKVNNKNKDKKIKNIFILFI